MDALEDAMFWGRLVEIGPYARDPAMIYLTIHAEDGFVAFAILPLANAYPLLSEGAYLVGRIPDKVAMKEAKFCGRVRL